MLTQAFIDDPTRLAVPRARLERLPNGRPLWLTYTIPWPDIPLLTVLETVRETPRAYWVSSAHPVELLGWGKAAELTDWGERRFHDIQVQAQHIATRLVPLNLDAPAEVGPRWLGSFSFQPRPADDEVWKSFPDAYFFLPRFQLARWNGDAWLTINRLVDEGWQVDELEVFFLNALAEAAALVGGTAPEGADLSLRPSTVRPNEVSVSLSRVRWEEMMAGALQRIQRGELEKVVLARTLQARFAEPPALPAILERLERRYPDCYRFMIELEPGLAFTGASPELLAEVCAPDFRTTALAGTIRRGGNPAEDIRLGQALLDSAKDRAEQAIVVRAIAGKLQPLTETLDIAPRPVLRVLGNVQHLETAIRGRLAPGWGVLDVVAALHPTPALGGWPQHAAQEYLSQAEPFGRGWYAAPVGWFDPLGNGLFAVAIRSGLFDGATATLFAGAGIVAGSTAEKEWQETALKFRPLLDAIGEANTHIRPPMETA